MFAKYPFNLTAIDLNLNSDRSLRGDRRIHVVFVYFDYGELI